MSDMMQDRDSLRQALLPLILAEVPFEGWSRKALLAAGHLMGYDALTVERAFPGGPVEVIEYWHDQADAAMVAALASQDLTVLRLRDKVALAVKMRLDAAAEHREAVRRAMALLALPIHGALAMKLAARTVDTIWRAVGDRSSDFSWYTKRASLGAIYGATLLYWLEDRSEGSEASWQFLERRIDTLMLLPKLTNRVKAITDKVPDPFALLRRARFGTRNG